MIFMELFSSHIINLLTNMPKTCFEELLSPAVLEDETGNDEHNGKNMEAINIILRFLDHRAAKVEVKIFGLFAQEFPMGFLGIKKCQRSPLTCSSTSHSHVSI